MSKRTSTAGRQPWRILARILLAACLLLLLASALRQGVFRGAPGEALLPAPVESHAGLELHMLDVGQGQALLLTCGGESAMVDAGLSSTAEDTADYLWAQGVRRLHYLFITHPHSDHCGGASAILSQVGAETLVVPRYLSEEATLATAGDWVGDTDTGIAITHTGESFPLGQATITVLHPPADNDIDEMNDLSLVLLVEYQGKRLLITGDITREVEEQLLSIGPVDALQVAHHGSATSSCQAFLEALSPDIALISCGRNNEYGHPHASVLERLEAIGAEIRRTDLEGTLILRVQEGFLSVAADN